MREFLFFEIEFFSKRVLDQDCQNCLKDTRKKIKEFFDYADCSGKSLINSENLFKAVIFLKKIENLETTIPVTTSMVNDFFLKSMEINSATIDLKEFTYSILTGYMERLFNPEGTS